MHLDGPGLPEAGARRRYSAHGKRQPETVRNDASHRVRTNRSGSRWALAWRAALSQRGNLKGILVDASVRFVGARGLFRRTAIRPPREVDCAITRTGTGWRLRSLHG